MVPGLGPLEGPVMLTLWQAPEPLSVPEVSQGLGYYRPIASSTVMTVLNKTTCAARTSPVAFMPAAAGATPRRGALMTIWPTGCVT